EYNRNPSQRKPGILELDTSDVVLAQNKLLTNTVEELSKQMSNLIHLLQYHQENQVYQRGNDAALRNLETQIGQIAKQVANNNDQGGPFTANTTTNPKEQCKSITTRSGKEIGKGIGDNLETERVVVELREKQEGEKEESEEEAKEKNNEGELVENQKNGKNEKNEKEELEGEVSKERKTKNQKAREKKSIQKSPPVQNLPYPHAQSKKDKERQ
ncbi:hypothetical protein A2U01_0040674, partial [Trifolium medium]|nr:hypothetical protein [Trifolium medium]